MNFVFAHIGLKSGNLGSTESETSLLIWRNICSLHSGRRLGLIQARILHKLKAKTAWSCSALVFFGFFFLHETNNMWWNRVSFYRLHGKVCFSPEMKPRLLESKVSFEKNRATIFGYTPLLWLLLLTETRFLQILRGKMDSPALWLLFIKARRLWLVAETYRLSF